MHISYKPQNLIINKFTLIYIKHQHYKQNNSKLKAHYLNFKVCNFTHEKLAMDKTASLLSKSKLNISIIIKYTNPKHINLINLKIRKKKKIKYRLDINEQVRSPILAKLSHDKEPVMNKSNNSHEYELHQQHLKFNIPNIF